MLKKSGQGRRAHIIILNSGKKDLPLLEYGGKGK
ncbi:hypothetical protein C5S36_13530 [Candidatus Methanophagaceae archaeon]|nr:hypothetical protein C5S36_13530 [Methanophagales archaeon]